MCTSASPQISSRGQTQTEALIPGECAPRVTTVTLAAHARRGLVAASLFVLHLQECVRSRGAGGATTPHVCVKATPPVIALVIDTIMHAAIEVFAALAETFSSCSCLVCFHNMGLSQNALELISERAH